MKRIFTFLASLMLVASMASAQTVIRNGVFSNMYLGIGGGLTTGTVNGPVDNFVSPVDFSTIPYNAFLELGKDVTPVTGFSLEGIANADFSNGFEIDRVDVFGNTKFNLMNLFGGYKGYPRRFEIKTVTGIGWNRNIDAALVSNYTANDIALRAALEFDFNLGKNRNWFVTFVPSVQANNILHSVNIEPMVMGSELKADIGVAYRIGKGHRSHNFELCPYSYTEEEYDILYGMYDECINSVPVTDTVVVENTVETVEQNVVETVVEKTKLLDLVIYFEKGSCDLSKIKLEQIKAFAEAVGEDVKVKVVGSADTATGTEGFNTDIATKRAEAVSKVLSDNGVKNIEMCIKMDVDQDPSSSRCAIVKLAE